jgi:hypothetical protein
MKRMVETSASGYRRRIVVKMSPRIMRSCVAHAVESHCTVSTPSSIPAGSQWAATS